MDLALRAASSSFSAPAVNGCFPFLPEEAAGRLEAPGRKSWASAASLKLSSLAVRVSLTSSRCFAEKGQLGMNAEIEAAQQKLAAKLDAAEAAVPLAERRKANFVGH